MTNKNNDSKEMDIFNELKKEKEKSKENTKTNFSNNKEISTNTSTNTSTEIVIGSKDEEDRIQRSFYITPKLDRELDKLKAQTGRDKSELVRIAISNLVENVTIE